MSPESTANPGFALPFPQDHAASALSGQVLLGKDTIARSWGVTDNNGAVDLLSTSNSQYALYEFTAVTLEPDHVDLVFDSEATTDAWIAVANYPSQRWSFFGPCSDSQSVSLSSANNRSPLGNIYIAVLVGHEARARLKHLELYTPNASPVPALTAQPAGGPVPQLVTFDASGSHDPDGSIFDYEWDFDGNGIFNETGPEADARGIAKPAPYRYNTAETVTVSVRVTDNLGDIAVKALPVVIHEDYPPVAVISGDVEEGDAPLSVTYSAFGSHDDDGYIVDYEWDFDGNGVFNEDWNGEAAARGSVFPPAFVFPTLGVYHPALRVTDNLGGVGVGTTTITVHGWVIVTVDSPGDVGQSPSLAVVNGFPAISYYDHTHGDLKFAYSSSTLGEDGSWTKLAIDTAGDVGSAPSLKVINGYPAVGYTDNDNQELKYAWSTLASGQANWDNITVDNTVNGGLIPSLALVSGHPAMSYYDWAHGDVRYAWSTSTDGSTGWNSLLVEHTGTPGEYCPLAVVAGHPAIVFGKWSTNEIKFAVSSTVNGSSGWSSTAITSASMGTNLAMVAGKPCFCYQLTNSPDHSLLFSANSLSDGSGTWSSIDVDHSQPNIGNSCWLADIGGLPAVAYADPNAGIYYADTTQADGSQGWQVHVVDPSPQDPHCSLAYVNGRPAVAYYDGSPASRDLKYAYRL